MKQKQLLGLIGLIVIVAALGISIAFTSGRDTAQMTERPATPAPAAPTDSAPSNSQYMDGEYMADAEYGTPGGREEISVSITLQNGVISGSSVNFSSDNPTAKSFQSRFESGYKDMIIGKGIDEVNLSRVSGSSLTSKGFNDALEQIKDQAQG